jgi:hypothetical protein
MIKKWISFSLSELQTDAFGMASRIGVHGPA